MRLLPALALSSLLLAPEALAQNRPRTRTPRPTPTATPAPRVVPPIDAWLYDEAMNRSQVMQHVSTLTDVYGPRLTGSPNLRAAGEWALQTMTGWGLTNPMRAAWDWGRPGWSNEYLAAHMTAPSPMPLVAEVLGWTPSTPGAVSGKVVQLVAPVRPSEERFAAWEDSVRQVVAGAIVLVGQPGVTQGQTPPGYTQRIADDVARQRFALSPDDQNLRPERAGVVPAPMPRPTPLGVSPADIETRLNALLKSAGALVRVNPAGMENGLIRAFSNRSFDPNDVVPTVVLRDEDFGRMVRLLRRGQAVEATFDIRNTQYPVAPEHNYLAEIPGTAPNEVVMLGGHLDSWHSATGATDNAAGSAVMMEAARMLAKYYHDTGTRPRRTIRVALWTGEEQGLLGSRAYVEQTFGSFESPKQPAFDGFNGYFNVDSGTGRLRGAQVFGPVEAAQRLGQYLSPLDSLGVAGARPTFSRSIGGSDHTSFNNAGLPGISMGQDPIAYFTTTWHTNVDTYERILEKDMQQAALTVALAVHRLANETERLPRFAADEMPAVPPAFRR